MKTIVNHLAAAAVDPRTVRMIFTAFAFVFIFLGRPEGDGGVAL